jgi:hypothetical protein
MVQDRRDCVENASASAPVSAAIVVANLLM